jgi:hypothetical protein
MKKLLIIPALALTLFAGGCATPAGQLFTTGVANPVGDDQLAAVISSYGVAQTAAIGYMNLPRCTKTANFSATNICSKRSVKVVIQAADRDASSAINKAVAFTRANPTLDASAVIDAAYQAVATFNQLETTYGVK